MCSRCNRALVVAALLMLFSAAASAAGRGVTFRADDGRAVAGVLFEPSVRPAAAVVLVPMLGRTRSDWDGVGQQLADAGLLALAIDLPATSDPGDSKVLAGWSADVHAAVLYLGARADVRAGAIGIAGASLGASLAALEAAADPAVRALALVSPSLDYHGVRIEAAMRQYGSRPALLLASQQDPYAARSARELANGAAGARDARFSDVAAHGTVLLARDPDMVRMLVDWFQTTLR